MPMNVWAGYFWTFSFIVLSEVLGLLRMWYRGEWDPLPANSQLSPLILSQGREPGTLGAQGYFTGICQSLSSLKDAQH